MFLIQNLLLFVNLFIFMGVPCLFSQSVLKKRLLPGKVLARGTRG